MKLSFVIPAHNEEAYIGTCLESILRELKRSKHPAEIIVVNNASTDRTKKIASAYPGVTVVDEPAKGIVKARARGLKDATGDLIANIDADAILPEGWLDTVCRAFLKNEELVCLSGPLIYYDLPLSARVIARLFYGFGFILYLINRFVLRHASLVQGGNFIFRRSAFQKIGGYDTRIEFYGEDTDIARRLHKVGDVKFSFNLPIMSSGRRLAHEGIVKTGFRYAINYFWMTFFKKPFTLTSTDVRLKKYESR